MARQIKRGMLFGILKVNALIMGVFTMLWGGVFTGCVYGCPADDCDFPLSSSSLGASSSSSVNSTYSSSSEMILRYGSPSVGP